MPSSTYDVISGSFITTRNDDGPEFLRRVVRILESFHDDFGPFGWSLSHNENRRYKNLDLDYLVEKVWVRDSFLKEYPRLWLCAKKPPYDLTVMIKLITDGGEIFVDRYKTSSLSFHINKYFFLHEGQVNTKRIDTFVSFMTSIYELSKPLCGDAHDSIDSMALSVSLSKRGLFRFFGFAYSAEYACIKLPHIDSPITGIYWANYLGSLGVNFYGRDRLLKAPGVVSRSDLSDGGMLMLTAPHPLTPDDPQHRANQLALWNYLQLKPEPNLKTIKKYKSSNPWKGAPSVFEP